MTRGKYLNITGVSSGCQERRQKKRQENLTKSGHPGSPGEGLVSHTLQCPGWDLDTGQLAAVVAMTQVVLKSLK